jgi:SNF2 family DNA or RNA helicase
MTSSTSHCPIETGLGAFDNYITTANLGSKDYQTTGVRWMLTNEHNGHAAGDKQVRGGILADEMGLGKTIQAIGAMIGNFKNGPGTLIVLPLSLLDQWENIFLQTLGHQPLIYHGSKKHEITVEQLQTAPIVITTYGMLVIPKTAKDTLLHRVNWGRIIFDEAHHMRNKKTKLFVDALKLKSDIKWLITGTPIQNRMSDFYSLCAQLGLPEVYYTSPSKINELVRNFVLRRTKADVGLRLPELHSQTIQVPWSNTAEKSLAEQIHSLLQFSKVNMDHVDSAVAAMGAECVLPILIRARQACIFPPLIADHINKLVKMGILEDSTTILEATQHSSKIDKLIETIRQRSETPEQRARSKLVFCHYRGEIDIIDKRLAKSGLCVETFDGRTPIRKRDSILNNNECDVLILQIQTGCEGLNLQHFQEVYFVSPHWNPAVEDQAVARCHRIGQQHEINVFRFSMASFDDEYETNTLDEYSSSVQEAKRKIMTKITQDTDCSDEP